MRTFYFLLFSLFFVNLDAQVLVIEQDSAIASVDVNEHFTGDFKFPIYYNDSINATYAWTLSWDTPQEWKSQLCINPKKCYDFDETGAELEYEPGINYEYALKVFHENVCGEGTYTFRLLDVDGEIIDEFVNVLTAENCGVTNTKESQLISWKIAPNPAKEIISISNYEQFVSMNLYSINGMLMKSLEIQKEHDITDLKDGIYLLQVVDKNGFQATKRLIKR